MKREGKAYAACIGCGKYQRDHRRVRRGGTAVRLPHGHGQRPDGGPVRHRALGHSRPAQGGPGSHHRGGAQLCGAQAHRVHLRGGEAHFRLSPLGGVLREPGGTEDLHPPPGDHRPRPDRRVRGGQRAVRLPLHRHRHGHRHHHHRHRQRRGPAGRRHRPRGGHLLRRPDQPGGAALLHQPGHPGPRHRPGYGGVLAVGHGVRHRLYAGRLLRQD